MVLLSFPGCSWICDPPPQLPEELGSRTCAAVPGSGHWFHSQARFSVLRYFSLDVPSMDSNRKVCGEGLREDTSGSVRTARLSPSLHHLPHHHWAWGDSATDFFNHLWVCTLRASVAWGPSSPWSGELLLHGDLLPELTFTAWTPGLHPPRAPVGHAQQRLSGSPRLSLRVAFAGFQDH